MISGWMEGTLNGKRGMFPDNFVKVQKQTKKVNCNGRRSSSNWIF